MLTEASILNPDADLHKIIEQMKAQARSVLFRDMGPHTLEDLVSETIFRLVKSGKNIQEICEDLKTPGNRIAAMRQTLSNLHEYHTAGKRHDDKQVPLEAAGDTEDMGETSNPELALVKKERKDIYLEAVELASLSADEKLVLKLFSAGYNRKEIAEKMGKTVNSVSVIRNRAIKDIQAAIEQTEKA